MVAVWRELSVGFSDDFEKQGDSRSAASILNQLLFPGIPDVLPRSATLLSQVRSGKQN